LFQILEAYFFLLSSWYVEKLEDLGDDDILVGPHVEVENIIMMVFNRNWSQVFLCESITSLIYLCHLLIKGTIKQFNDIKIIVFSKIF